MNKLLFTIISLSISGSLVAVVLLLLKPLVKHRLSKAWQYYIYLIVIMRLLLPFGPDSNLMNTFFTQFGEPAAPVADNTILAEPQATSPKEDAAIPTPLWGREIEKNAARQMISGWLWRIWLVPAVLLLLLKLLAYNRNTYAIKRGSEPITNMQLLASYQHICTEMGIKRPPALLANKQLSTPMLVGILRPCIILSDLKLSHIECGHIFRHELTHYKRLDILYKWFLEIAAAIHWFNPIVYKIRKEINQNCELACDAAAIGQLSEQERYAYGDMLLNSIQVAQETSRLSPVSIALSKEATFIKERLNGIMKQPRKSRKTLFASVTIAVLVVFGAIFSGVYAGGTSRNKPTIMDNMPEAMSEASPLFINDVSLTNYAGETPEDRWPYIHWVLTNDSKKTISGYEIVFLAYDVDGNPLKLNWSRLTETEEASDDKKLKTYALQATTTDASLAPGAKEDLDGGWTLFDGWDKTDGSHKVAYIMACIKQVTYEDGTVWQNNAYDFWAFAYEGKSVDTEILRGYYG